MSDPAKDADAKSANAAGPDAAAPATAPPATKALGADAGKPNVPGVKTAPIKLMAGFTDLPGATTTGANESKSDNALWLDTSLTPTAPMGGRGPQHFGVTRGQGALIGTYDAPLTDQTPAVGTGELATRLLYGSKVDQSFAVVVTGLDPKKKAAAYQEARTLTAQATEREGNVSVIETTVAAALAAKYPAAAGSSIQVKITPAKSATSVTDGGLRKLYYKVGGASSIDMEVKSVPAGKAEVRASNATEDTAGGGAQVTGHSEHQHDDVTSNDTKAHVDGHQEQSVETMTVESTQLLVELENKFVASFSRAVTELQSSLFKKVKREADNPQRDHTVTDFTNGVYDDYSNHNTKTSEEGDKPKRNWASYLESVAKIAKNVVSGPGGVGTLEWPEIVWGLGVARDAAHEFAVNGTVHYTEKHDDTDVKDHPGGTDHTDKDRHIDNTIHDKTKQFENLKSKLDSSATSFVNEVKTTTKSEQDKYHSVATKTASGGHAAVDTDTSHKTTDRTGASGDTHIDAQRSKTTRIQYEVSATKTYLRPQLEATVTEGDGEVASTPFSSITKPRTP